VNDLGFLFFRIEVRDVQRRDGPKGHGEDLLGARPVAPSSQICPDLPQGAKGSRPIEPLTLTVLAEIRHRSTPPPGLIFTQLSKRKRLCHPRRMTHTCRPLTGALILVAMAGLVRGTAASAAEIKVLTAGAFKPVVMELVPEFERETGHTVVVENDTAGALTRRITGGEAFDLVVLTPAALEQLAQAGQVVAGSVSRLAQVGIGVAVKAGQPAPAISTVAAFQQALLAARAVAYIDPAAGGSSGIYLSRLFERMGIADRIAPKAVLVPGGLVAERVVSGEAEIGIHQISEILAVPGATLVGPIPAEIQNYTVYAGAVGAAARDASAAQAFLSRLGGRRARAILTGKGMEAPR
jgi:molybdate transport system substrate-binding protein